MFLRVLLSSGGRVKTSIDILSIECHDFPRLTVCGYSNLHLTVPYFHFYAVSQRKQLFSLACMFLLFGENNLISQHMLY